MNTSDEQIIELSHQVDRILALLCVIHETNPLDLAAVINARLMIACAAGDVEKDFRQLLLDISEIEKPSLQPTQAMH